MKNGEAGFELLINALEFIYIFNLTLKVVLRFPELSKTDMRLFAICSYFPKNKYGLYQECKGTKTYRDRSIT